MSIASEIIRLCEKEGPFEYSCLMFRIPKSASAKIKELQNQIDVDDIHPEEGLEEDVHITLLWGIEDGTKSGRVAKEILAHSSPIEVKTGEVEIFKPKDKDYEVIVVRVYGDGLHSLRNKVESELPNKQTFPEYKPHMTIGYVLKGKGSKYKDLKMDKTSFIVDSVKYNNAEIDSDILMVIG